MIKRLIRGLGLVMFCWMLLVTPVRAEEAGQAVVLRNNDDGVEIVLSGSDQEVHSLHLNFEIVAVKGELDTYEVSFAPGGAIGKDVFISEPFLQKDGSNIILDIYASSKQNLLKNRELVLGVVKLAPEKGSVTADVRIGSVETVNATQEMSVNEGTQYKPAQITAGKDVPKPEEPDDNDSQEPEKPDDNNSQEPEKPDDNNSQEPGEGDGGGTQKPGENGGDSGQDRRPEQSNSNNHTNDSKNDQIVRKDDNTSNSSPNLIADNTPQTIIENPPIQESAMNPSENDNPSASTKTQKEKPSSEQPVAQSETAHVEMTESEPIELAMETDTLPEKEKESVEYIDNIGESIQIIEEQEPSGMGTGVKILIGVIIGVLLLTGVVFAVRASRKK